MSEPVLYAQGLTKRYGSNAVVDNVDIRIAPGETLCLLGPSGCGKSTILRMIAGIEMPDGGEIRIGGECMAGGPDNVFVPSEKRNVGLVFQSYAIWPHMTVAQNVGYPLEVRRVPAGELERKVDEVLAVVGLSGYRARPATQLSGGQQQRVALARALVYSPRLLLLDEPLSNLDARLRDELRNEIRRIQRELSLTVLYVTHDQIEAMTLADRIAVMSQGKIIQSGTPAQVYDTPNSLFVQNFLGKTYVLEGVLQRDGGAERVCLEGGLSFRVDGSPAIASGARVSVSVRAEDIGIDPEGSGAVDGFEQLPADVREVRFLGDRQECVLTIDRAQFCIECGRAVQIAQGQRVYLSFPRERMRTWQTAAS